MPRDLDVRLLRSFLVVAEELHFTRAAARLHVAQQALSRDIRRLEGELGTPLLQRTTRRVSLTPAGERLLPRARRFVAANDQLIAELRDDERPILVDVMGEHLTPTHILDRARRLAPDVEFVARFHGGLGAALPQLEAGKIDVAFGRWQRGVTPLSQQLAGRVVRLEPIGVLVLAEIPRSPCGWHSMPRPPALSVWTGEHVAIPDPQPAWFGMPPTLPLLDRAVALTLIAPTTVEIHRAELRPPAPWFGCPARPAEDR